MLSKVLLTTFFERWKANHLGQDLRGGEISCYYIKNTISFMIQRLNLEKQNEGYGVWFLDKKINVLFVKSAGVLVFECTSNIFFINPWMW